MRVLVVTGGLLTGKEPGIWPAVKKQWLQWRASRHAWLELKIKALAAEVLVPGLIEARRSTDPQVKAYFANRETFETPDLTEVILTTLLAREGLSYDITTYDELIMLPRRRDVLLDRTNVVFASSTLLHDLSELEPLMRLIKRPHNRIVLGGALAGQLWREWSGDGTVEILAVGYGEYLVESLAGWIRSGFMALSAPTRGRIVRRGRMTILFAGVPDSTSLDDLVTPDWSLSDRDHGGRFSLIHYESVRGCPYRCSFCNYPFLFDDTKFRYKSASKIADDWVRYKEELGVAYISCLDSLFTLPRRRLVELCEQLIERDVGIKWICYARADDLADRRIVQLMKRAGAHQVQIGLESGHPQILSNMNKQASVDDNAKAIDNCRAEGLTTVVSLIVGFPGETEQTLETTYQFLKAHRPDFHFLATFSTRVLTVPVLSPESRDRFGLVVSDNKYTLSPYWSHATMSCAHVGRHQRDLQRQLIEEQISLDGILFYGGILHYGPDQRRSLLDYQYRVFTQHPVVSRLFDLGHSWIDQRLEKDVAKLLVPS